MVVEVEVIDTVEMVAEVEVEIVVDLEAERQ